MKKITLFTLTTLLLLNCSNNEPPIPCQDGICLTDEQLNFFKMYLKDDTLTKKVLFEMSSMDLSSKDITSLDTGIFNNLINLTSVDLTDNTICVDKGDVGLADGVTLTFDRWNCITNEQLTFFNGRIMSITTKKQLYDATSLNLSNKSITSLDTGIFNNLTNLTDLNLSFNALTSIPAEIGNLTSLTQLLLFNNDLTSIPTDIGNLTNLTTLRLYNNKLTTLQNGIFTNLANLTRLELYNNDLTTLQNGIFTNLANLTRLELKLGSIGTNSFTCNDTNYTAWGLDTTSLPTTFFCNNL